MVPNLTTAAMAPATAEAVMMAKNVSGERVIAADAFTGAQSQYLGHAVGRPGPLRIMLLRARKDRIDANDNAEPIEKRRAGRPNRAHGEEQPTEPIDSTDPREAIESTESCDQSDHFGLGAFTGQSLVLGYRRRLNSGPATSPVQGPSARRSTPVFRRS